MGKGRGMIKQAPSSRDAVRLSMRVPVMYWIVGREDEKKKATTLDVSRTGVGMEVEVLEGIERSTVLGMELNMDGDIVRAEGEVVMVKERGPNAYIVGVRFTKISDENMRKFLKYVRLIGVPLNERIDKKQEQYFVERLFQGDRERYQATVKTLSDIPTWEKASRKIDELWAQYGIDRFSEPSMDFTDIVYAATD